jgi:hypothetical protein
MRLAPAIVAALASLSAAAIAVPNSPLTELAGRYTYKFKNGDISGATYSSTDVVEVVPLDKRQAEISFDLNFFNGHSCSLYGVAKLEGRKLVYREKSEWLPDEPECRLEIWRDTRNLRWEDQGTCHFACGSRGGFGNGKMSVKGRRPIHGRRAHPPAV